VSAVDACRICRQGPDLHLAGGSEAPRHAAVVCRTELGTGVPREQHRANGRGDTGSLDFFLDPFVGDPVSENLELAETAKSIAYATPDDLPFLIIHGIAAPVVPCQQSVMLRDALESVDVTFRTMEGGDHGRASIFTAQELLDEIAAWLDAKLGVAR
jgi:hypothetical protein